jgi:hypothetical protein
MESAPSQVAQEEDVQGESSSSAAPPRRTEKLFPGFSNSVNNAVRRLSLDAPVPAAAIINRLFVLHPEYANHKAKDTQLDEAAPADRQKTVSEWLEQVRPIYASDKVRLIHGTLLIVALSYLDPEMGKQLITNDMLSAIEAEAVTQTNKDNKSTNYTLADILTIEGNARRRFLLEGPGITDFAPTLADYATEVDQLGREAYAVALATYIRNLWDEEAWQHYNRKETTGYNGTFMLDIHGPWGAGKTSLLNFLRKELKSGGDLTLRQKAPPDWASKKLKNLGLRDPYSKWVTIDFNAWQHQRIGAPWWWLMNAVYKQAHGQLKQMGDTRASFDLWRREKWWRFWNGNWPPYILALCLLAVLVYLVGAMLVNLGVFNVFTQNQQGSGPGEFVEFLGGIATLFLGIIAILGSIMALSRWLLGPTRAAEDILRSNRDPMKALTGHFNTLVLTIGHPVAIFIDDLDRCKSDYVIDLLDGIQTLFKNAPVTYVVAADRRWIYTSYENMYSNMATRVNELGRPLGHLFLEKIFQLSAPVPRMSSETQAQYLNRLLQTGGAPEQELQDAEEKARQRLAELGDRVEDVLDETKTTGDDPLYDQAFREEAVKRMATQTAVKDTENMLRPFATLLEPNPRAMKRFVTAYGVHRAVAVLAGVNSLLDKTGRKQLALWTIASLRWPLLAEYLADHPEMVGQVGVEPLADPGPDVAPIPANLRALFQDEDVDRVVRGEGVDTSLDEDIIRACALLSTSDAGRGWNEDSS